VAVSGTGLSGARAVADFLRRRERRRSLSDGIDAAVSARAPARARSAVELDVAVQRVGAGGTVRLCLARADESARLVVPPPRQAVVAALPRLGPGGAGQVGSPDTRPASAGSACAHRALQRVARAMRVRCPAGCPIHVQHAPGECRVPSKQDNYSERPSGTTVLQQATDCQMCSASFAACAFGRSPAP